MKTKNLLLTFLMLLGVVFKSSGQDNKALKDNSSAPATVVLQPTLPVKDSTVINVNSKNLFTRAATDPWVLGGNSIAAGDFLGTINSTPLTIKVGNLERLQITNSGRFDVNNTSGGGSNLYFGKNTGNETTSSITGNTAFGNLSLTLVSSGFQNTAVGYNVLSKTTIGTYNTAIGGFSLSSNEEGNNNTALGASALRANLKGNNNTASGTNSLNSSTGDNNTAYGASTLRSMSTGSNNLAIGFASGSNLTSGDNNVFIGAQTNANISNTASNQLNIANKIYGSGSGSTASIGIGVLNPQAQLHTSGTLEFDGLGTNAENIKVLTTNDAGQVTTRVLNNWGTASTTNQLSVDGTNLTSNVNGVTSSVPLSSFPNIYNANGTLTNDRTVNIGNYKLNFGAANNSVLLNSPGFNDTTKSSLLSVLNNTQFVEPNLSNYGMFSSGRLNNAYLTQGVGNTASWFQSVKIVQNASTNNSYKLTLNPLGGNVGVGVANPQAQLHTNNTVRFDNLENKTGTPTNILGTDANGNVYEYSPSIFQLPISLSNDWTLTGNANTNSLVNFLGTTNNVDLMFRRGNIFAGRLGSNNTSFGVNSLSNPALVGNNNTAMGVNNLTSNLTGVNNVAIGSNVLAQNINGSYNVGIGSNALTISKGNRNIAVGNGSLRNNNTGSLNVSIGEQANELNTNGSYNTAVGGYAFRNNQTGQFNTSLGYSAGRDLTSGNNNIFLGYNTAPNISVTGSNQLNIGNKIYGSGINNTVAIGIGVANPQARLHTNGTLRFAGLASNTSNVNILTTDAAGNVTTRPFYDWTTVNRNIYNGDGIVLSNRIVALNSKTLDFNFGVSPTSLSKNTITINPSTTTTTSNLSVAVNRTDVENLQGKGHSRIEKVNTTGLSSFLTTGFNINYFWTQASVGNNQNVSANYLINPLGGKVAIGTSNIDLDTACPDCNDYRLFVKQGIRTEKVRVDLANVKGWADYVFEKDYKLMSLEDLEKFVYANKHLPNIPKAEDVVKTGIDLGLMNSKLLEKVEELTLHAIEANKKSDKLEQENKELNVVLADLIHRLEELEKAAKK